MSEARFEWIERGSGVIVEPGPDGYGVRLEVRTEAWRLPVEVSPRGVDELASWLSGMIDNPLAERVDELEFECRRLEDERDEAIARAEAAEAALAEARAELEGRYPTVPRVDTVRTLEGRTR